MFRTGGGRVIAGQAPVGESDILQRGRPEPRRVPARGAVVRLLVAGERPPGVARVMERVAFQPQVVDELFPQVLWLGGLLESLGALPRRGRAKD